MSPLPLPWHVHRHESAACYDCGETASVVVSGPGARRFHLCGHCWASLGSPREAFLSQDGLVGARREAHLAPVAAPGTPQTAAPPAPGRERGRLGTPPATENECVT